MNCIFELCFASVLSMKRISYSYCSLNVLQMSKKGNEMKIGNE